MSLLDRLDVPLAQSRSSTIAVVRPRVTASSALPAPTTPPPTTRTSISFSAIRAIASRRPAGDSAVTTGFSRRCRSVDLYPVKGAVDRLLPARVAFGPLLLVPLRQPALGLVPVGAELIRVGPEAGGQAGRVRGAERGGLGDDGAADRDTEDVGLELHTQVVGGDAAVDLERFQVHAGVLLHRLADVAALVADGLQGGPGQVGVGVVARQPDDGAARVAAPVRREQAGDRGHEVDAAVVGGLPGQRLDLRGAGDDAELVAQPLHRRPGHGDGALERVDRLLLAELGADGGEQAVLAADDLLAGVEQHEVAGAVGVLRLARREADLADRGRLLVAEVAGERHAGQRPEPDLAVAARRGRRPDRGEHLPRDAEEPEQLVVPVEGLQVHQHGPAGVRRVGDGPASFRAAGQ